MKSLIIFFSCSMFFQFATVETNPEPVQKTLEIEILNEEEIDFDFSIEYKSRRNQIHVRSEKSIRSLQLINEKDEIKEYKVIGSNLVFLPTSDFPIGTEKQVKIRFLRNPIEIIARIKSSSETDLGS